MKPFKDSKNRTWQLELNCDTVEEIRAQCAVNILDLLDPESDLAKEVASFPPVIGKLLFAAISDQAKTAGVDDREFRRSMNGETLNAAYEALQEEIVNFSPRYRRKVAAAVLEKNREVQEAAEELALARLADPELKTQVLAGLEANLRREMQTAMDRLGGQRSEVRDQDSETESSPAVGTPPASSDSPAPDRTPGDSSAG
jgi:hypothetical protein